MCTTPVQCDAQCGAQSEAEMGGTKPQNFSSENIWTFFLVRPDIDMHIE